jgi:glutathione S-transferase
VEAAKPPWQRYVLKYVEINSRSDYLQALTAPFILRIYALAKYDVLPQSMITGLDNLPNFSKWAHQVIKLESVTYTWDEEKIIPEMKRRFAAAKV